MSARSFFAMRLLMEAEEIDRRNKERRDKMKRRALSPTSRIDDIHFVRRYRLSKISFKYLCFMLKENTYLRSSQRVSLETKVLSALLFYANGDYQRVISAAHKLSQKAISTYVDEVTDALNQPSIVNEFIKFPSTREARDRVKHNFYDMYGFPGVVGCVDGCRIRILKPHRDEEHLYYCSKHNHSLNVQLIADHEGRILSINSKLGGASQDSFVWENSKINLFMQTLHQNGESVWLLGDSGYPLRPWLLTPYENPVSDSAEETYNKLLSKTRVIIENTFRHLKNRWQCLRKDRILHYKPAKCAKIIIACSVLHNLALDFNMAPVEEIIIETSEFEGGSNISQEVEDEEESSLLALGHLQRDEVACSLHNSNTL